MDSDEGISRTDEDEIGDTEENSCKSPLSPNSNAVGVLDFAQIKSIQTEEQFAEDNEQVQAKQNDLFNFDKLH